MDKRWTTTSIALIWRLFNNVKNTFVWTNKETHTTLFQSPCDLNYVQLTSVQRRKNNIFVCWHKQNAVVEKKNVDFIFLR